MMWYTAGKDLLLLWPGKKPVPLSYSGLLHFSKPFSFLYIYPMPYLNVEIKAKCPDVHFIRRYLLSNNADFKGIDEQTDTYFNVQNGRLKLREGNIENNLIYYQRENKAGPKHSFFRLVKVEDAAGLKKILTDSLSIKVIVIKRREIYYIGNVKFHIDEVNQLGSFMEIEAGNMLAAYTEKELREQCDFYMKVFGIKYEDLIEYSYCDMMIALHST